MLSCLLEGSCRKKRRKEHYVSGTARGVYQLYTVKWKNAMDLSPTFEGVCSGISRGFFKLKQQGTELKKRKARMPSAKHPDRQHYHDINAQNEWLRGNVFGKLHVLPFMYQEGT